MTCKRLACQTAWQFHCIPSGPECMHDSIWALGMHEWENDADQVAPQPCLQSPPFVAPLLGGGGERKEVRRYLTGPLCRDGDSVGAAV
eukprot:356001-Chlamydomonas_euryale.AAC.5